MRTDDFWAVIDRARAGGPADASAIAARAGAELAERDPAEIVGWSRHLDRVLAASQKADLWGAAYLINGGCSDEGFDAFRGWLLTQGRQVFAGAVAAPDGLADLPAVRQAALTGLEFAATEMLDVPAEAHRRATAAELPPPEQPVVRPDVADFWDFDDPDQVRDRLPRLAELFLEPPAE
ncbi:DUF4240 domain-containing protein [Plantactinospora sp. KBS50]|uniref:DUF4240 domain-containing protein n=1 Tax=Plantactinospora sp. KBS50 TaxID=2024580 RepID=UPI000BAB00C1|nr:DUF4240 domain-containing protein [Plantactinospora sp. KBS50]ASW56268.1 hypothetical protein CIK06_22065 [Plantactinospora sp. KBS50]